MGQRQNSQDQDQDSDPQPDMEFSRLASWSRDISRPYFESLGLGLGLEAAAVTKQEMSFKSVLMNY